MILCGIGERDLVDNAPSLIPLPQVGKDNCLSPCIQWLADLQLRAEPVGDQLNREMWENCASFIHEEAGLDRVSFEDVFDVDMLSLLPFDLQGDAPFNPPA